MPETVKPVIGQCSVCGGENVEVRELPEGHFEAGVVDFECTDRPACTTRYDTKTEEYGWLR